MPGLGQVGKWVGQAPSALGTCELPRPSEWLWAVVWAGFMVFLLGEEPSSGELLSPSKGLAQTHEGSGPTLARPSPAQPGLGSSLS